MVKLMKNVIKTVCLTIVLSNYVFADPTIENVTGEMVSGNTIVISGDGFGAGPIIRIFDDFNKGIPGEVIQTNATVGNWSGLSIKTPYYIADGDDNVAALLVDGDTTRQLHLDFVGVNEVFLSYKVRIPIGYNFPNTSTNNTFSSGSDWKLAWIMDGASGYHGNDDICLPTWPNGTYFMLAGNDNAFQISTGRPGTSSNWFSFEGWNDFKVYLKGGIDPEADSGVVWAMGMSFEFGQKTFSATPVVFDGDDNASDDDISQWSHMNVPGWHRGGGENVRAIYDDLYVATGANARARVEIGDAANYGDCKIIDILTPDNWSDDSISATVRLNAFQASATENVYLFVVDSDGIASSGYDLMNLDNSDTASDDDEDEAGDVGGDETGDVGGDEAGDVGGDEAGDGDGDEAGGGCFVLTVLQ